MSIHYDGKCENCGKVHPDVTVPVHTRPQPGMYGVEEWCLDCVQGKNSYVKKPPR